MTKVHHLRMRTVQFDRARHALLGMPTCSLCHAKFTRWETLEAHIRNQRCTQELPTILATEAKGHKASPEPSTEDGPLCPLLAPLLLKCRLPKALCYPMLVMIVVRSLVSLGSSLRPGPMTRKKGQCKQIVMADRRAPLRPPQYRLFLILATLLR